MSRKVKLICISLMVVLLLFAFTGCSETVDNGGNNGNNGNAIENNGDKDNDEYVNTAVEVELFAGTFTVGEDEDVIPGRYEVTTSSGSGNFIVYEGQMPVVNEILANNLEEAFGLGVTKLQIDLEKGQTIEISGLNNVNFKPAIIELRTALVSGNHLVGRDVPAGTYIATTSTGSGNFIVYNGSMPVVNEILASDAEESFGLGVEKIKFSVKNGQMIEISGLELVELEVE